MTRQGLGLETGRVDSFELLSDEGAKIPVSVERAPASTTYWVRPVLALDPMRSYRMRFERPCDEGPQWIEQRFSTSDVVNVPHTLAAGVRVSRAQGTRSVPTSSGSCTTEINADTAHIELDLAAEWQPVLPVTRVHVLVDGKAWAQLTPSEPGAPLTTDVIAGCDVSDSGALGFVAPGRHKVELRAEVIGHTERPETIELEVDLPCAAASGDEAAPSQASGCSLTAVRRGNAYGRDATMLVALMYLRRRARKAAGDSKGA